MSSTLSQNTCVKVTITIPAGIVTFVPQPPAP